MEVAFCFRLHDFFKKDYCVTAAHYELTLIFRKQKDRITVEAVAAEMELMKRPDYIEILRYRKQEEEEYVPDPIPKEIVEPRKNGFPEPMYTVFKKHILHRTDLATRLSLRRASLYLRSSVDDFPEVIPKIKLEIGHSKASIIHDKFKTVYQQAAKGCVVTCIQDGTKRSFYAKNGFYVDDAGVDFKSITDNQKLVIDKLKIALVAAEDREDYSWGLESMMEMLGSAEIKPKIRNLCFEFGLTRSFGKLLEVIDPVWLETIVMKELNLPSVTRNLKPGFFKIFDQNGFMNAKTFVTDVKQLKEDIPDIVKQFDYIKLISLEVLNVDDLTTIIKILLNRRKFEEMTIEIPEPGVDDDIRNAFADERQENTNVYHFEYSHPVAILVMILSRNEIVFRGPAYDATFDLAVPKVGNQQCNTCSCYEFY